MNALHYVSKGRVSGCGLTIATRGRFYALSGLIRSNVIVFVLNITRSIKRMVER